MASRVLRSQTEREMRQVEERLCSADTQTWVASSTSAPKCRIDWQFQSWDDYRQSPGRIHGVQEPAAGLDVSSTQAGISEDIQLATDK